MRVRSVSAQDIDMAVVKATNHDNCTPKEKHVRSAFPPPTAIYTNSPPRQRPPTPWGTSRFDASRGPRALPASCAFRRTKATKLVPRTKRGPEIGRPPDARINRCNTPRNTLTTLNPSQTETRALNLELVTNTSRDGSRLCACFVRDPQDERNNASTPPTFLGG